MAPRKEPKSLLSSCYKTVGSLVLRKCQQIDDSYTIDQREWEDESEKLQNYLLAKVPPLLWDSVSESVFSRAKAGGSFRDCSVLYSTLVCMYTKTLVVQRLCGSNSSKDFYDSFVEEIIAPNKSTKKHCDMWLKLVTKLKNLESFNYYSFSYYNGFDLIALLKHCVKLRYLRWTNGACSSDEVKRALETFPQLEEITFPYMGLVMASLDERRRLNLRHFTHCLQCLPAHVEKAILLCPHLQSITFKPDDLESSEEIFALLADCSLRLTEINVEDFHFGENARHFLSRKGEYITALALKCSGGDLYSAVVLVGETCSSLSSLRIHHVAHTACTKQDEGATLFRKLTTLEYAGRSVAIPLLVLSRSSIVHTFKFQCPLDPSDEDMIALLSPAWCAHMERISCYIRSEAVLRHIYSSCPKIRALGRVCVRSGRHSVEIKLVRYLNQIRQEIKDENLDLDLGCSSHGYI